MGAARPGGELGSLNKNQLVKDIQTLNTLLGGRGHVPLSATAEGLGFLPRPTLVCSGDIQRDWRRPGHRVFWASCWVGIMMMVILLLTSHFYMD